MPATAYIEAVRRAAAAASKHSHVRSVSDVLELEDGGTASLEITFDVALPNEWRSEGVSPKTGVRLEEVIRFDFPSAYPLAAPTPSLRPDFNRDLPHVQPYLTFDRRPIPCIYDGKLDELLHLQGWTGLLNYATIWLERAATVDLIDPDQGWEPTRRDSLRDCVIADTTDVQGLVDRHGGMVFRRTLYMRFVLADGDEFVLARISSERISAKRDNASKIFEERQLPTEQPTFRGKSLSIVVWPGKRPSGDLIVNRSYLPETVSNIGELQRRAKDYECSRQLNDGLQQLRKMFSGYKPVGPFKLLIVLLARRPFAVIGSNSAIEICPYVVDVSAPSLFVNAQSTRVYPAAHRDEISPNLLAQMAGESPLASLRKWTLLGAGSLGSKIAIHLARAGRGPDIVIDRSNLSPHNAARHALLPDGGSAQYHWMRDKAGALCEALAGLSTTAEPIVGDAVNLMRARSSHRCFGHKTWAVVNATASLTVAQALASTDTVEARVLETSLLAQGQLGVVTVEGPERNPNTTDLMAESYRLFAGDIALSRTVFGAEAGQLERVGQGCGSLTIAMSDGRLSLFAAAMAEHVLSLQRNGLPEHGEVLLGQLSNRNLGLAWRAHSVAPTTVVPMENAGWRVRIGDFARRKIEAEVHEWPAVETGGVLIGRLFEADRSVYVADVLSAPEDSTRSRNEFILGTEGLLSEIRRYSAVVRGALYCVGTWHSHLSSSGPSSVDRATTQLLSVAEATPSVLLIHTPGGYRGLLADVR